MGILGLVQRVDFKFLHSMEVASGSRRGTV
jgi:hypothetical protein